MTFILDFGGLYECFDLFFGIFLRFLDFFDTWSNSCSLRYFYPWIKLLPHFRNWIAQESESGRAGNPPEPLSNPSTGFLYALQSLCDLSVPAPFIRIFSNLLTPQHFSLKCERLFRSVFRPPYFILYQTEKCYPAAPPPSSHSGDPHPPLLPWPRHQSMAMAPPIREVGSL